MSKKLSVKEVLNSFDFNVVNKGKANSRYITCSGIARVGIELTAKVKPACKKQSNPVSFGRSELNYFNNCSKSDLHRAIKRIKALDPPMIILNSSFGPQDVKMILKEFGKTDITIAHINMSSADLYFEISP
ncbi:MAG: hypothetical protein MJ223_00625 [Mycoplasmoidaceae bacterium]|nr:hypothetical protein [Mycoplasmoidaceae bacterium]